MTEKKKVLDVTTTNWSKPDIEKLRQSLIAQGMKWKAKLLYPDGRIRFAYCREPDGSDIEGMVKGLGVKILSTERF